LKGTWKYAGKKKHKNGVQKAKLKYIWHLSAFLASFSTFQPFLNLIGELGMGMYSGQIQCGTGMPHRILSFTMYG